MARWAPQAQERLARAALELFAEQGFAATTVPQITERAGLTTRTFFRHYADKREVLFGGEDAIVAMVERFIAEAPPAETPMDLIAAGLEAMATAEGLFEGRLAELRIRRAVVDANPELRERELQKLALTADVIAAGLRHRGVDDLQATLAARLGVTVLNVAVGRWLDGDPAQPLVQVVRETRSALRGLGT